MFVQSQLGIVGSGFVASPEEFGAKTSIFLKKAGGMWIGTVCSMYSILGRAFILNIATLPNQENSGLSQCLRSAVSLFKIFKWNVFQLGGQLYA